MKKKLLLLGLLFVGFNTVKPNCTIASMELDRESGFFLIGASATAWLLNSWLNKPTIETAAQRAEKLDLQNKFEKQSLNREHRLLQEHKKIVENLQAKQIEAERQKLLSLQEQELIRASEREAELENLRIREKREKRALTEKLHQEAEHARQLSADLTATKEAQLQRERAQEQAKVENLREQEQIQERVRAEDARALSERLRKEEEHTVKVVEAETKARLQTEKRLQSLVWEKQRHWIEEQTQAKETEWAATKAHLQREIENLKEENITLRAQLAEQDPKGLSSYCIGQLSAVKDELELTKTLLRNTRKNLERTFEQLAETTQQIEDLKKEHIEEIRREKHNLTEHYENFINTSFSPSRKKGYQNDNQ